MYIISPKPLDTRGGRSYSYSANVGVYSVSQPAFSGTELIGAHIPTQGAVWIGQNWEQKWAIGGHDPLQPLENFPRSGPALGTNHTPLGVPAPYAPKRQPAASQAPGQSEEVLGGRCGSASQQAGGRSRACPGVLELQVLRTPRAGVRRLAGLSGDFGDHAGDRGVG